MSAKTTLIRAGVWAVLTGFTGLSGQWKRMARLEEPGILDQFFSSGIGDLPAVTVVPVLETPQWFVHQEQATGYTVDIQVLCNLLSQAETYVETIWKGLHQHKRVGQDLEEIRRITGYYPQSLSVKTQIVGVGKDVTQSRAWLATMSVGLRYQADPFN